jgi:hypothetical protein
MAILRIELELIMRTQTKKAKVNSHQCCKYDSKRQYKSIVQSFFKLSTKNKRKGNKSKK